MTDFPTPLEPLRRPGWLPWRAWWEPLGLRAATASVGAYRVHWVEAGAGEEAVVLLHGLSGSARWWQRNIPALGSTYRLLIPDVIGFGRSRIRGLLPDVATVAGVLAEWIEAAGLERVHLVGHSMGGHLSIHLASRHPERVGRLVLVDAAGMPRPVTPRSVARLLYDMAPPRQWGDPAFLPVIWGDVLVTPFWVTASAIRSILRDDVRPLLPKMETPTLLVWGEMDALIPLENGRRMRELIPDSRLLVLHGATHNVMIDRAEEFNPAVMAFLRGEEVGE